MNQTSSDVLDRHLSLALGELAGQATPPDRVEAILRRLAPRSSARRGLHGRSRLAVAAAMLLGVGITIAVAMVRPRVTSDGAGSFAAAPMAAMQEPAPKAKPDSGKLPVAPAPNAPVHPKGSDPRDLAAVRSAEKMLEQEQKLMARLREGKLPGVDRLRFETLGGWKYTKGLDGIPDATKALDGQKIAMIGFMLPIDEVKDIRHFLLVQSLWSCCYGTPPDVNGIVRVELPKDRPIDYSFEPLLITGTLRVGATFEDGYCVDIYQLHADSVVELK